jgi:hypothetical protein
MLSSNHLHQVSAVAHIQRHQSSLVKAQESIASITLALDICEGNDSIDTRMSSQVNRYGSKSIDLLSSTLVPREISLKDAGACSPVQQCMKQGETTSPRLDFILKSRDSVTQCDDTLSTSSFTVSDNDSDTSIVKKSTVAHQHHLNQRTVRFANSDNDKDSVVVEVHVVPSRHDYTPDEKRAVWWSESYMTTFKDCARNSSLLQRTKNEKLIDRCLSSTYRKACQIVFDENENDQTALYDAIMNDPTEHVGFLLEWTNSSTRQVLECHGLERTLMSLLNGGNSSTTNNNRNIFGKKSRALVREWSKMGATDHVLAQMYHEHCLAFALLARMTGHATMIAVQKQAETYDNSNARPAAIRSKLSSLASSTEGRVTQGKKIMRSRTSRLEH